MRIKKRLVGTVFTLTTALLLASCSGHHASEGDSPNGDDPIEVGSLSGDPSTAATTDDAPPSDPASQDPLPTDDSNLVANATPPTMPDALPAGDPAMDASSTGATAVLSESAEEPAPVRTPRKSKHKKLSKVSSRKAKVRKAAAPVIEETPVEDATLSQSQADPMAAQQAQMTADASVPPATPMPTQVQTPAPTPAQVQNARTETTPVNTTDYIKYGLLGALVIGAVAYFVFGKKSS